MFNLKKNNGSVLVMVILIAAILGILGVTSLSFSVNENKYAVKEHEYQQAYYIARGGAEAVASYLYNNQHTVPELNEMLSKTTDDLNNKDATSFGGGSFKASIMTGNSTNLLIESKGKFNGIEREVKLLLSRQDLFDDNAALVLDNILDFSDGFVTGNLLADETATLEIKQQATLYGETLYKDLDYESPVKNPFPYVLPFEEMGLVQNSDFDYTASNPLTLNSDGEYEDHYIGNLTMGNNDLSFNLSNDMDLYLNNLSAGGNLTVNGSGKLTLYVKEVNDFRCEIITSENSLLLIVVYKESEDETLTGTLTIKTGNSGAENLYIFAPENTVDLSASTKIKGAIIADTIAIGSGQTYVTFVKPIYDIYNDDVGFNKYTYEMAQWMED
jgi:hypothetical protein